MATLANVQTLYKSFLQDQAKILEEIQGSLDVVRDQSIKDAIRWYSRRAPQKKTVLVASVATGFYAVPSDWKPGSRIVTVEFPLDQTPPIYYGPRAWQFQRRDTGLFYYLTPNPSGSYRLTYTTKYDETTPTAIPDEHEEILARVAVYFSAIDFASRYANSVSNNLDAVQYRSKEQEWRAVAKEHLSAAEQLLRRDEWAEMFQTDPDQYPPFRVWR